MKQPSVVIVGHVCIDNNVTEHVTYHGWGSPAMYIADYYRRSLKLPTTIIAPWGKDFLPYTNDVTMIPAKPLQPGTLLYRNIITSDLRTWYCEHTAYAVPPVIDDTIIDALRSADICILAPLLPNYPVTYVQKVFSYLRKDCVTALCAQGYLRTISPENKIEARDCVEAAALLPLFDVTVLSEEDHPHAASMVDDWKQLMNHGNIILTQGAAGAIVLSASETDHIPTEPVPDEDIIDSVGCGDVFLGSLIYEYYSGQTIKKAVAKAHIAARNKLLNTNLTTTADLNR